MQKKEKILIIGAGGHARSIIDTILDGNEYEVYGVTSSAPSDWDGYRGVSWVGTDSDATEVYERGCHLAALGIGFMGGKSKVRERVCEEYRVCGFSFPPIIEPSAIVSGGAEVEEGAFIGKGAIVGAKVNIGKFAIVNSGALVEHDCVVGDFTHVAVRAVLCGEVCVDASVLVGANATVIQRLSVGEGSVLGAGAIVLADVPAHERVLGVYKGRS